MYPATTNRGLPGVEYSSAACRAQRSRALFNSQRISLEPYSASTSGRAPKDVRLNNSPHRLKVLRWSPANRAGRPHPDSRCSLQRRAPKIAANKSRACSMVPCAVLEPRGAPPATLSAPEGCSVSHSVPRLGHHLDAVQAQGYRDIYGLSRGGKRTFY